MKYKLEKIVQDLYKALTKNNTKIDLGRFKRESAKKYKIACPSNIELLKVYHELVKNKRAKKNKNIENILKTRPIRSLSGIVNISVLTKPYPCPGRCLYCPVEKGIPKSYLSGEPAVERAKKLNYDPYMQVKKRIEMLELEGHPTDKIELRIVGGTWSYYPRKYQVWFVGNCFMAANNSPRPSNPNLVLKLTEEIKRLKKEQRKNEKAKHRVVGLSIETRPDFISKEEIKWLREMGVTMVELGVQSIYDDVLKFNRRGHKTIETIKSTKLLKDAGFKVLYQIMPNLPASDLKRDKEMFKKLFSNPDFRPDYLKIYPCVVLKEAPLYKLWKTNKYTPYSQSQLVNLLKLIKQEIPYYVRIQRITRDIPSQRIVGGTKISNLRQILNEKMKIEGRQCRCIRCREVKEKFNPKERIYLFRQDYEASQGREIFLSLENKKRTKLYSLLRLRIPSQFFGTEDYLFPVLKNSSIIREIHTYGETVPILEQKNAPQHQGLGKKLIKEAERITQKEFCLKKIAAISGVGVRGYFRKLNYKLRETYMVKSLG